MGLTHSLVDSAPRLTRVAVVPGERFASYIGGTAADLRVTHGRRGEPND